MSPVPEFSDLPLDESEERPITPSGRVDCWQRKFLGLPLRNRLLKFKDSKQTVPFVCPDVPLLEDRLAEGKKMRIISLVEDFSVPERDANVHFHRTKQDLEQEFARQALERDEISSPLDSQGLNSRLIELFCRVKNDLAEGASLVGNLEGFRLQKSAASARSDLYTIMRLDIRPRPDWSKNIRWIARSDRNARGRDPARRCLPSSIRQVRWSMKLSQVRINSILI